MSIRHEGPKHFAQFNGKFGTSIWDTLRESPKPDYSVSTWRHYQPLFSGALDEVEGRLDDIMKSHSTILPGEIQNLIIRTSNQLRVEKRAYDFVTIDEVIKPEGKDAFFAQRFTSVVRTLEKLSREVDRRREEL